MPRPVNERRLGTNLFSVRPSASSPPRPGEIRLGLDEAEALRLADLEGLYHEAAARSMGVSRPTFGRILESARRKAAEAVLGGKSVKIEGGEVSVREEGEIMMKIAVPSRDGVVDQHFGHCKEFLVYTASGNTLKEEAAVPSGESCGCKSGIAGVLAKAGVTHLVAGNMGDGAANVLRSHGIAVVRGASGEAKAAAEAFVLGSFQDNGLTCSDHDHEHAGDRGPGCKNQE